MPNLRHLGSDFSDAQHVYMFKAQCTLIQAAVAGTQHFCKSDPRGLMLSTQNMQSKQFSGYLQSLVYMTCITYKNLLAGKGMGSRSPSWHSASLPRRPSVTFLYSPDSIIPHLSRVRNETGVKGLRKGI